MIFIFDEVKLVNILKYKMELNLIKCETCLSSDRQLVCIAKIKFIIDEILFSQIHRSDGGVCWECYRVMVKFYKFRTQVKQAQTVLSGNVEDQQIRTLSTLTQNTIKNYDFEFTYYCDPLINAESEKELKAKPILIKQEDDFDDRFNSDSDNDEKPLSKVFTDRIKVENVLEKRNHKKKKNIGQDKKKFKENISKKKNPNSNMEHGKKVRNETLKEEQKRDNSNSNKEYLVSKKEYSKKVLKEKFDTIMFTEAEMLKCREEKQNQANFKKIPFKCSSCVIGFFTKEKYDLHAKKIHDESIGNHTCPVCQARFPTVTAVSNHCTKHYLQYRCKLCDYKVSSGTAAVNHGRDKHVNDGAGRIHCKQCVFIARTSKELAEHVKAEHSLVCNECGVQFKGMNTLRSHKIRIHSVKREFSCETCSKTFKSKSRLECHAARHSRALAQSLAYCAHCDVQYKDIQVYRNHLRNSVNHVLNRISCPDCDKKFASRAYWTKHYNFYHLRRSRYRCDDCAKMFMSEWRLKLHKQTHHGLARTRDHQCTVCDKKFYTRATLLTHSHLHAASRAFMCARCGATFRQRAALYTHVRRLHT